MNHKKIIPESVRCALVLGTGFAALGAAHAQEPVSEGPVRDSGKVEEVIVTGSLIKRSDFDTPSPVQVITARDLQQSGFTSVKDVLSSLSANGMGTLSQSFPGAFAGGAAGIALRGLTVGETLTLFDGSRMVGYPLPDDGERSFVDTSAIPMLAVDHIDVLKDGASAAYGSDAIAGVVNVALRRTFKGLEASAEGGLTSHGDGVTGRVTAIGGLGDLATDGYNAYLAVEWRHQSAINDFSRSGAWNQQNWTSEGGINGAPGAGSVFTQLGATPFPAGSGVYLVPGGATSYQSPGVIFLGAGCASAAAVAADQCTFLPSLQIQPRTGNLNILGRVTQSLGADWKATLTASFFESQAQQIGEYARTSPSATPFNPFTFPLYGPGFASVGSMPPVVVPVGNPMNPTDQPLYPVGRLFELGQTGTNFSSDTYRVFADFSGPLAGWDVELNLGGMYALTTQRYLSVINYTALQTALDNGYVFGEGAAAAGIVDPISSSMSNSLQVADLRGTRELLALPGGTLTLAVGAGYYHSYLDATQSPAALAGIYAGNLAYAYGGQTDFNAYGEIVAPVLPGLEIDASGRYDHYNNTGGSGVPKIGLKWTPFTHLTLRGTWGEGYRAPNPAESGHAASAFLYNRSADAVLCPSSNAGKTSVYNLNAPVTPQAGDVASFCNFAPVYIQGTNPALRPERSTNWTAGFILTPVEQVKLSVDYWSNRIRDVILTDSLFGALPLPPGPVLNVRSGPVTLPVLQADGGTVDRVFPQGEPVYIGTAYENAGQIVVNGIDLELASHVDIGRLGRLSAKLTWSHELKWEASSSYGGGSASVELAGTHGPSGVSGDTANPRDRGVLTFSWDRGPLDVTWTVNHVGGYSLIDPAVGEATCADAVNDYSSKFLSGTFPSQYCRVPHFTYVNLYAQYAVSPALTVYGSAVNLFNTAPPVDIVTYGAGLLSYNSSLAQPGAVGTLFNVGVKLTF